MSSIQVWTSDGDWSEKVGGCDKIHLMKKAIETECRIVQQNCDKYASGRDLYVVIEEFEDGTKTRETIHNSGIYIDAEAIDVIEIMTKDFKGIDLSNASFFKMRLSTLRTMAEEEETMSAVYNKIIDCAKVPVKVSRDYFLLFMFSTE